MKTQLILLMLLVGSSLQAQTHISGRVRSTQGQPLAGANVTVVGTFDGAATDAEGRFRFVSSLPDSAWLEISYLGFKSHRQLLPRRDSVVVDVRLKELVNEMKAVTITAGSFEASDTKKAVILRPLDIVTTASAAGDIVGALNTLPGASRVADDGRLFVRGGDASETRTYLDGVPVPSPYNQGLPGVPVRGRYSPFLFNGTFFSTGGYSAEYGDALSGVLILNTNDLPAKSMLEVSLLSVGAGLQQHIVGKKQSLSLAANYFDLKPYMAVVPQNLDWGRAPHGGDLTLNYRRKTQGGGMFKVFSSGQLGRSRLNGVWGDTQTIRLQNDNVYTNVSLRQPLGNKLSLQSGVAHSYDQQLTLPGSLTLNRTEQVLTHRSVLRYQLSDAVSLKGGIETNYRKYDFGFRDSSSLNLGFSGWYNAAFAEMDVYLTNRITLRTGLRAESSAFTSSRRLANRTALAIKAGENGQFSAAYGRFFQDPDRDYLLYGVADREQADHYVLSYQYQAKKRLLRAEGFVKTYADLLQFEQPLGVNGPLQNIRNSGYGHAYGLDLLWRDQSIPYLDYWVSYSWLETQRLQHTQPVLAQPSFAPAHQLSVVGKYYFAKLTSQAGFTWTSVAGRPYDDPSTAAYPDGKTPAYHDLSVNWSYLTELFGNFTIVYASVSNVLGRDNVFGYRFVNDGSSWQRTEVGQTARRFFVVGVFISLGRNQRSDADAL
jgi:hypothetical protein